MQREQEESGGFSVQRKSCMISLRVVDFAIGLVNSVLNLHNTRQMNFFRKFKLEKQL